MSSPLPQVQTRAKQRPPNLKEITRLKAHVHDLSGLVRPRSDTDTPTRSFDSRPSVNMLRVTQPRISSSKRLVRRQYLLTERRALAHHSLLFALVGIAFMIVEQELQISFPTTQSTLFVPSVWPVLCLLLKLSMTGSTIALLYSLIKYHWTDVQLYMNDNGAEDWRVVVTSRRLTQLALELTICACCPLPGDRWLLQMWSAQGPKGTAPNQGAVPVSVYLSLIMFARLYLVCRVLLLHSTVFEAATSRSIGSLNRVHFNQRFVLKTLMTLSPGSLLLVVTVSYWVIASWMLRLCERYDVGGRSSTEQQCHPLPHSRSLTQTRDNKGNYLNSMWIVAITFLAVGYGDIVPQSNCGRCISVVSGVMGVSVSSMVVAVLARKLELSRAEKHVHNFMMKTHQKKRLKHAAANVLRECWLIFRSRCCQRTANSRAASLRTHQRKLILAIRQFRAIRHQIRRIAENSWTIGDIATNSERTYDLMTEFSKWQLQVSNQLACHEHRIRAIQHGLNHLHELVQNTVTNNRPVKTQT